MISNFFPVFDFPGPHTAALIEFATKKTQTAVNDIQEAWRTFVCGVYRQARRGAQELYDLRGHGFEEVKNLILQRNKL